MKSYVEVQPIFARMAKISEFIYKAVNKSLLSFQSTMNRNH